ncbi:cellulose binding domain-containing protein [Saccharothrix xinjiangensis]|uniref:Cellulose binding domain-containing protein n=1 Tax=Saccharothrix xinjiangensis TaxID=204798 RepID=A0ABV9YG91_9PSEU
MKLERALPGAVTAVAGVLALTTGATAAPAHDTVPASAQADCHYTYTAWNFAGGFSATLTVTNTGPDPATGWWIEFDLSAGALIQTTSGGRFLTRSGHIHVTAPDWLRDLAPGRHANIVINGSNTASTGVTVADVTLKDVPCTA